MIRLIRRRLIIPRGDTGSFSIPTLGTVSDGDIAVFGIFDPLTHNTVVTKVVAATEEYLTIPFVAEDTINLEPRKYNWDITIYHSPVYDEEGVLIGAAEVNSYYSAYKLPVCEIREIVDNRSEINSSKITSNDADTAALINVNAIYPWRNLELSSLSQDIYTIAKAYGCEEDEEVFWSKFSKGSIVMSDVENFPLIGEESKLYLDKNTGVLYYFIITEGNVQKELAAAVGAIVNGGTEEQVTYLYIPVKAMPVQNLIINGGEING